MSGIDTLSYSSLTTATTVDLSAKTMAATSNLSAKDYFDNVELIQTGSGADNITLAAVVTLRFTLDGGVVLILLITAQFQKISRHHGWGIRCNGGCRYSR